MRRDRLAVMEVTVEQIWARLKANMETEERELDDLLLSNSPVAHLPYVITSVACYKQNKTKVTRLMEDSGTRLACSRALVRRLSQARHACKADSGKEALVTC